MIRDRFAIIVWFAAMLAAVDARAAPGDIAFSDAFDAGPVTCTTLAPNWTTSDANLAGVGTFTANSNSCALFTRGDAVNVESVTFDLSGAIGARLDAWVRKGSDAFSEDPDNAAENLVVEYITAGGTWISIASFDSVTLAPGAVTTVAIDLPFGALHANAQIRFRQLGGSGGPPANGGLGWDFWHVDDVVVIETGSAPTPPDLALDNCDDFERGFINWTPTDGTRAGVSGVTSNSPSNSMFLRHSTVEATSVAVDASLLAEVTVWIQRGSDAIAGSENPETGEDLTLEYLNSSLVWTTLETFPGGGTQGQIFNRTYPATLDFLHANFQLRFSLSTGSGVDFDYWHIDDVCLNSGAPNIQIVKNVDLDSDPISGGSGPYAIPGAVARYTVDVTNIGDGSVDGDTLVFRDEIDPQAMFFAGDLDGAGSPFVFNNGAAPNESGVTLFFDSVSSLIDDVTFFDSGGAPITPTVGYDASIASFEIQFSGSLRPALSGAQPTFSFEYVVQVE